MAVRIRLTRKGAKKKPFYRIVAADSEAPRDGRFLEVLGTYDPLKDPAEVKVDGEALKKWLDRGATPSDTVSSLLKAQGLITPAAQGEAAPAQS
jgi:small subunit ribosomal protein S16